MLRHEESQETFPNRSATLRRVSNIEKWSDEDLCLYKKMLTYSLRCIKFLLHQGLAFRGHDESDESSNRGNFIELLKFLAGNN
jgi:hypothetical protein